MTRKFDSFMHKNLKCKTYNICIIDIIFLLCICFIGFLIRFSMRHIVSGDADGSLSDWYNFISQNGGFKALAIESFQYEYNCLYMYILCLISYIKSPFSSMYWIKLASVFFDYFLTVCIFKIIYELTQDMHRSILGFSVTLLFPTIAMNSAAWSQCDSMYASFLVLSFYYILKEKSFLSLLCFGLSFAFKLQAIFFLPFLLIMWLKGRIKLRHFFIVPIPLFVSILPVWLMGRSLSFLLGRYLWQTSAYSNLSLNYPNIYCFLKNNVYTENLGSTGMLFTIALLGCLAYYIYHKNVNLTPNIMILLALFTVAVTVFFLPHMHERYGYVIDLMAIIYGIYNTRKVYLSIGFEFVSFLSYAPYLFKSKTIPLYCVTILMLVLIIQVGYNLHNEILKEEKINKGP